jgi:hypothetical protein
MIDNLKLLMNAEVTKATSNISGDWSGEKTWHGISFIIW